VGERWLTAVGVQAAKTAVAAGVSWFIASDVLGNSIPVFAPLAALLTVQVTLWESISRGLQRIAGVVVGVLVAYAFARLAGINSWSIALVIFVSLVVGRAMRLGQQGSVQVPVSALLVLALGATTPGYAVDRVVDTAIGAGCGILVNLAAPPGTRLADAQAQLLGLANSIAALLRDMASELATAGTAPDWGRYLLRARQFADLASSASGALARTRTAARWSPRGRRDNQAVARLHAGLVLLGHIERAARGTARTLYDAPAGWSAPPEVASPLAELLRRTAQDIEEWAAATVVAPGGAGAVVPRSSDDESNKTGAPYHAVLAAARARGVSAEGAAIVSSIALDAHRISEELQERPEEVPLTTRRLSWRAIFGP
jgi:uncharacterized membrane protein YgaE (UPF0421/DUF939 family)